MKFGIGIDVGGTGTKLAAVGANGRVLRSLEIHTKPWLSAGRFIRRVASRIHLLESEMGRAAAVGLAIAGDVDAERGILRFAPNLPAWNRFNFRRALGAELKRPVIVENDANLAAWGAWAVELKRGPRNAVGITLGTGVGGGIIVDGQLHRGATGSAGEIGHMQLHAAGPRCRCGRRGCLEAFAGSWALARRTRELMKKDPRGAARFKRRAGPGRLDGLLLARAAEQGDPLARRVWREAGQALAAGISNLVLILNPEAILILGGLARAGSLLMDPIRSSLAKEPFKTPFKAVSVKLVKDAPWGCVGAGLLALDAADDA